MGIFNLPKNEEPVLSRAEKQVRTAQNIKALANQGFQGLFKTAKLGLVLVWENPDGLSPQEVFDSLGTDAGAYLNVARKTIALLNEELPGTLPEETPKPVTINDDGTVTVGE